MKTVDSRRYVRVAYQGGPGSHSERAGLKLLAERFTGWPFASFADAAAALANAQARPGPGSADLLLLPIHNSTTGEIEDALEAAKGLNSLGDITLPVEHYLLAVPGVRRDELRVAWAHPQVEMQCRNWVAKSGLEVRIVDDGARRAPDFLASNLRHVGVLGPIGIGTATGLYPLEGPIQDRADNRTTFRLLARSGADIPICVAERSEAELSNTRRGARAVTTKEEVLT
jgi:arogenate/prephenate dehydratase